MTIRLKMWPLERTQAKKLKTDDPRRTQHYHNSSGKLKIHFVSQMLVQSFWVIFLQQQFSFSHSVFYLFRELSAISIEIEIVCKLLQFGRVYNLTFGKAENLIKRLTYRLKKNQICFLATVWYVTI